METAELNDIKTDLINEAISYFEAAYKKASPKTEPKIIFNMHYEIHNLEKKWNNIIQSQFPNKNLLIIPIFVHNRPIVDFDFPEDDKGKEFGDLLYIHTDLKKNKTKGGFDKIKQTALLLQAKVNSNTRPDKKQNHLYAQWPEFSFKDKEFVDHLKSNNFKVMNTPSNHTGARYLFIENRKEMESSFNFIEERFHTFDVTTEPIDKEVSPKYLFVDNLVNLLDFSEGREVHIKEPLSCDWTRAIDAVTDWAIGRWNPKNLVKTYKDEPRYKLLSLLRSTPNEWISNDKINLFEGPKVFPEGYQYDPDSNPFIIIHIITLDQNSRD